LCKIIPTGGGNTFKYSATGTNYWNFANVNGNIGTRIQIGQSLAVPTFSDFSINTVFPSSPENGQVGSTAGVYFVGLGQAKTSGVFSPTANAGSVGESALIISMKDLGNAVRQVMIAHDKISPVVPFLAGQAINIEYTIQI